MNVAERAHSWARAVSQLPKRTVVAVAEALEIDPATLVDLGYQLEASSLPPGVEEVVFVPARTTGQIAYVELAVDLSVNELVGAFGPAQPLPARLHGGGQVAFDGIPGLAVVADTDEDRVRSLTFILLDGPK